jgi:molecular chaperone GrpE (heat shock protein)
MSEPQIEVDTSPAAEAPAQNEAPTTEENAKAEPSNENQEAEAVEKAEEPELTPEQKVEQLESKIAEQEKKAERRQAAYRDLQKAHEKKLQELKKLETQTKPQEPVNEPKVEDFDTFEDFQKARDEYVAETAKQEAIKEFQNKQLQLEQQKIALERQTLVQQQEQEYLNVNPNYMASKAEFEQFVKLMDVDPAVERAIVDQTFLGNVPQTIDYFAGNGGENLDKLREISQLSPPQAAVEVYKIQQSLKAPKAEEVKPAPKPAKKPKGGSAPKKDIGDGDVLKNLGLK